MGIPRAVTRELKTAHLPQDAKLNSSWLKTSTGKEALFFELNWFSATHNSVLWWSESWLRLLQLVRQTPGLHLGQSSRPSCMGDDGDIGDAVWNWGTNGAWIAVEA